MRSTGSSVRTVRGSRRRFGRCWVWSASMVGRSGCSVSIRGADAVAIHRRLAYVPGDVALWPNLSGGEMIDLLIRLRGADPAGRQSRRTELLERFQLDPTKRGRAYSKGNRQKVALVAALATPSELLILDEPTSGLDPLMEQVFNECIAEHTAAGATVLLSSHILSEVERLAQQVTIIRDGRSVETGSLAAMRHLHRNHVRAEVAGTVPDLTAIAGRARRGRRRPDVVVFGRTRGDDRATRRIGRGGRAHVDEHAADVGGAVPRCVPRRSGRRPPLSITSTHPHPAGRWGVAGPDGAAPGSDDGARLVRRAGRGLLRLGGLDADVVCDCCRAGAGRAGDQREPGVGGALRPDPRRAQHRRAGDDQDDRPLRRLGRGDGAVRRPPAHAPRRGGWAGGADRRRSDGPGCAAVGGDDRRCRCCRRPRSARRSGQHRRRPSDARVARLRCLVGRHRSRRRRAHRCVVSALAERTHMRGDRVGRDRSAVRRSAPSGTRRTRRG